MQTERWNLLSTTELDRIYPETLEVLERAAEKLLCSPFLRLMFEIRAGSSNSSACPYLYIRGKPEYKQKDRILN
jgi:hypothetical protein